MAGRWPNYRTGIRRDVVAIVVLSPLKGVVTASRVAVGSQRNKRHCQSYCGRGHVFDFKSVGRHENMAHDGTSGEITNTVPDTNRSARGYFQFVSRPGPDVGEDVSVCGRVVYDKRMATNSYLICQLVKSRLKYKKQVSMSKHVKYLPVNKNNI